MIRILLVVLLCGHPFFSPCVSLWLQPIILPAYETERDAGYGCVWQHGATQLDEDELHDIVESAQGWVFKVSAKTLQGRDGRIGG